MGHEFGKTIEWPNIFYEEQRHNTPMTAWLPVILLQKRHQSGHCATCFHDVSSEQSVSSSFP